MWGFLDRFFNGVPGDQYDHILILDLVPVGPQILERDLEFYWPGDSWRVDHHVVLRSRSQ